MAYIRKRGNRWQAIVRKVGHPAKAKTFKTKNEAIRWAESVSSALESPLVDQPNDVLKSLTLRDLLERYRETETPKKRGGWSERYRINNILKRPIVSISLDKLTSGVFAKYRDERLKVVGPQGVIHELNTFSIVLKTARIEWDIPLGPNPLNDVRRPKMPKGRTRRLLPEEYERLKEAALNGPSPYIWPVVAFAVETGMRQGEIRNLTWPGVFFERRIAHLEMTKNGEARSIPLTAKAVEILMVQKQSKLPVPFPYTVGAVRNAWDKVLRKTGIQDLRLHDLRHEAISRFFEMGLSVPEVAVISGHKDFRMLARYTHLRAEDLVGKMPT